MAKPDRRKKASAKAAKGGAKQPFAARFVASRASRVAAIAFGAACFVGAVAWAAHGCGWNPSEPFVRNSPDVDDAIRALDAGANATAAEILEAYLDTGACGGDGGLHGSSMVQKRHDGSFDLGLTLFNIAESYGRRFGEEEIDAGGPDRSAKRDAEIECALVIVRIISGDLTVPTELRARAFYLAGNLELLRGKYEDAVTAYDKALRLVPGTAEEAGLDGIGRDVAWNRAIALRRIEDRKDAGNDANDSGDDAADGSDGNDGSDGSNGDDGGKDGGEDAGNDGGGDGGDGDGGNGDGGSGDAGADAAPASPDAGGGKPSDREPPKAEPHGADDRILEQLEEAPTYQEEEAKKRAGARRRSTNMEDK